VHQCDEDEEDFHEEVSNLHDAWSLSSKGCKRIFVPINDIMNRSRASFMKPGGGSHWSLLLWTIASKDKTQDSTLPTSTFYHFDSSNGYNASAASVVSQKLIKVLYCNSPIIVQTTNTTVKECKSPQQNNGYDCGVYLLGFAEALSSCDWPVMKCCQQQYEVALREYIGGAEFASILRKRIANDVRGFISTESNDLL
jgi:Ulp1 family protease